MATDDTAPTDTFEPLTAGPGTPRHATPRRRAWGFLNDLTSEVRQQLARLDLAVPVAGAEGDLDAPSPDDAPAALGAAAAPTAATAPDAANHPDDDEPWNLHDLAGLASSALKIADGAAAQADTARSEAHAALGHAHAAQADAAAAIIEARNAQSETSAARGEAAAVLAELEATRAELARLGATVARNATIAWSVGGAGLTLAAVSLVVALQ
ncbi:hypothetical protein [Antribacter gilvus]|uniref:hypothetical protein n=1 Tax=Antribacter gilvus TaxID=2304675 RepID=UPI000F781368|nr:hypothetical protein [Antribacter gilvus]